VTEPLLRVRGLRTTFRTPEGVFPAVDGADFDVHPGETLGLVGESGCGKTVTALSLLRLLPEPPARLESGEALFEGRDLLRLPLPELRRIRGNRIAMIFQEPMTSLNPVFTIGDQIEEALKVHTALDRAGRKRRVAELLELVGIPSPTERMGSYPHELSGGMRQRVMIAMALACEPALLIADEPTTALDVTIEAQILELLDSLKRRLGMAILLITHDLGIVAETAQRVAVVYAGRVVETAPVDLLFRSPRHPYTQGLLLSVPGAQIPRRARLHVIPGAVPDLTSRPSGCRFRDRCERALAVCERVDPPLAAAGPLRFVACHNPVPEPSP
jgi:peptide/nickel transport system ATP-binding protein